VSILPSTAAIKLHLDLDGTLESLSPLVHASVGLCTHNTTAPVTAGLLVLLEVTVVDGRHELGEFALVFGSDFSQGKNGSGLNRLAHIRVAIQPSLKYLLVDNGAESGLALHYRVRNTHLAAKSRKEDDQLDGVDVVGNQDQLRLLVLNKADNVVETVFGGVGLLGHIFLLLALGDRGSLLGQTLLLLSLRLRSILVQEFERLGGS